MDRWTKDTLKARYEELSPWYHKHRFPFGVGHTPDQEINQRVTRMIWRMDEHGAFPKLTYPQVLDLGANSGLLSMWFVDYKGSEVVAVENNDRHFAQLELAIEVKGYTGRIRPYKNDILTSIFGKDKYDLVLLLGVMNLVPVERRQPLLETALRALKPGCSIAVQTWEGGMGWGEDMINWQMFDMVRKLDKLGYDRYRIDGNYMTSVCRVWKKGGSDSWLQHISSSPDLAMAGVLALAEFLAKSDDEVKPSEIEELEDACASEATLILEDKEMVCFPGIPKAFGEWLDEEKSKLGIEP
jgi:SAM-dependent methyltransferase